MVHGTQEHGGLPAAQSSVWAVEGTIPEQWNIKEVFDSIDGHKGSQYGAYGQYSSRLTP
jgi:hypothetical protein